MWKSEVKGEGPVFLSTSALLTKSSSNLKSSSNSNPGTPTDQAKSCAWSSLYNLINYWYSKLKKCEVKCFPKCERQMQFCSSVAYGVFSSSCFKVFEEDVFCCCLKQNFILRCAYFEDRLLIRAWSILILKYFCFIVCWTMVPVSYISHYVRLVSDNILAGVREEGCHG